MPFVPAPNIVMLEMRYLMSAQKTENRLMVDMLTAPTGAAMSDLVDLALLWLGSSYRLNIGSNTFVSEVVATDMSVQNGVQVSAIPGLTIQGAKGSPLPNEAAFCVSLRSGSRGRSARGRWFAGSLSGEDRTDANTLTSAYVSDLVNSVQDLLDQITGTGVLPVIVSYRNNNAPRPGGPVYFPITNAVAVDNVIDSQRKRKPGVGS